MDQCSFRVRASSISSESGTRRTDRWGKKYSVGIPLASTRSELTVNNIDQYRERPYYRSNFQGYIRKKGVRVAPPISRKLNHQFPDVLQLPRAGNDGPGVQRFEVEGMSTPTG